MITRPAGTPHAQFGGCPQCGTGRPSLHVMRGLDPRISLRDALCLPKRDGRDKPGHDGELDSYFAEIDARPELRLDGFLAAVLGDLHHERPRFLGELVELEVAVVVGRRLGTAG